MLPYLLKHSCLLISLKTMIFSLKCSYKQTDGNNLLFSNPSISENILNSKIVKT